MVSGSEMAQPFICMVRDLVTLITTQSVADIWPFQRAVSKGTFASVYEKA